MLLTLVLACPAVPARAQNSPPGAPAAAPTSDPLNDLAKLSAPQAVRRGNQRLLSGDAQAALQAYEHAEQQRPDAREIAFGEGLAHYELGEYEQAREAFRKSAAASDDLAADARYSLGTCDHREALAKTNEPKEALSLLEDAMREYRDVLADRPDHAAARDANFKAASMWREIKRQLQQQQQQQDQNDNDQNKDDKDNQDQQNQQQQNQNKDDEQQQEKQQPSDSQENKDKEQRQSKESQQENDNKDQEQESEQTAQQDQKDQQQPQQAKQAEQKEQVSREQANRQLREMIQEMRDRKKTRVEQVEPLRVQPVDKDW